MPTINDGQPLRLEQGGRVRIEDADNADEPFEVVNREKGSVQLADGWYEALRYNDRGQMQVPLEGDEQPGTFRATLKLTSAEADELLDLSRRRGPSGLLRRWRVQAIWPAYKGASTTHALTLEAARFVRPVQVQEGQEFDTVMIEMEAASAAWEPVVIG